MVIGYHVTMGNVIIAWVNTGEKSQTKTQTRHEQLESEQIYNITFINYCHFGDSVKSKIPNG